MGCNNLRAIKNIWLAGVLSSVYMTGFAIAMPTTLNAETPDYGIPQDGDTENFEAKLQSAFKKLGKKKLNAIVAVSHSGVDYFYESGKLAKDALPAKTTQVDLNSITKTVTGIMVAKMMDQGTLTPNVTLKDIFGSQVPADKEAITLHQLLTHSAGIVDAVGDDYDRLEKQAFLEKVFESKLQHKPGTKYEYSNAGYGLVAAMIEARAGKSYEAFLIEDVLQGLEVSDTGYNSVYEDSRSLRARNGQTIQKVSWGGHPPYWNLIGNGGLISTPADMLVFLKAIAAGHILSPSSLDALTTPHVSENPETDESFYGYGLVVQQLEGLGRIYWHDGGNDALSTFYCVIPETGDVIFIAGIDKWRHEASEVRDILLESLYGTSM